MTKLCGVWPLGVHISLAIRSAYEYDHSGCNRVINIMPRESRIIVVSFIISAISGAFCRLCL